MPLIQAWECPKTGTLIKEKTDYIAHLKILAAASLEKKRSQRIRDTRKAWFKTMREQVKNFDEFKQFLFDNWEYFCRNAHDAENLYSTKARPFVYEHWLRPKTIEFRNLTYRPSASNSHGAPSNGVTNWGGKPDKPKGYPGWTCNMQINWHAPTNKKQKESHLLSSYFAGSTIYCGSGGGGTGGVSQEVTFWEYDWPTMAKIRELEQLARYLVRDDAEALAANPVTVP